MQNTAVFCDMDGTLLNSEHRISSRTQRAIAGLAGRGIPFAVVTSRGIAGTYPVLELGGVSCTAVTYGGGVILDEGRNVIFHDGFSRAKAQEVADFLGAECPNVAWIAYSFEDWVSPHRSDPRVRREERVVMAEARDGGVDSIERDEVQKILCICDPEDTLEVERRLSERFPELTVVKSSDILIEVMPAGLSKAGAVRFLCDHWGVDPAATTMTCPCSRSRGTATSWATHPTSCLPACRFTRRATTRTASPASSRNSVSSGRGCLARKTLVRDEKPSSRLQNIRS